MRSTLALSALLLAAPSVFGYRDTSPLLIWSSTPDSGLSDAAAEVTSGVVRADELYPTLTSLGCDWGTVLVGHMEDLHQTRLSLLNIPSSSPADLHIPYVLRPDQDLLNSAVGDWAKVCGAEVVNSVQAESSGKTIISIDVSESDDIFSKVSELAGSYMVILTGSPSLAKRQEYPSASSSFAAADPTSSQGGINTTIAKDGPLLDRVQLLTTPVIAGFLVSFLLLLPILYLGIASLAAIQVPPRMLEIGKTLVNKDRKDQ